MADKDVLEGAEQWSSTRGAAAGAVPRLSPEAEPQPTHIAAGCLLKGELRLNGKAEVDAVCDGEIVSKGQLIVGESGEVNGDITGDEVVVFGRVAGDIVCSSRLELHAGAHVTGSITSPRVVMQDGVIFEGECRMPEGEAPFQQTGIAHAAPADVEPAAKKVNS